MSTSDANRDAGDEHRDKDSNDNVPGDEEVFYQNAEIFRLQSDPFGKDFEQSLRGAPALPVRRRDANANSASASFAGRYSRQASSASSTSKKSSYDEVSLNAGRPVILSEDGDAPEDPLSAVSFESPLKDLESTPSAGLSHSLPSGPPVPAPRFSKMRSQSSVEEKGEEEEGAVYVNEVIYEELVPKDFPSRQSSLHMEGDASSPSGAGSRHVSSSGGGENAGSLPGCHQRERSGDNIYSELEVPGAPLAASSSENVNIPTGGGKNLLEEDDAPSEAISPTLPTILAAGSEKGGRLSGARAKHTTIDIRKDVNRLWDMAVEELHRDEHFVEFLEQRESQEESRRESTSSRRVSRGSANAYDSVAIPEQRFKIVDGVQVPIPLTLLKTFDPCFEKQEKEAKEEEDSKADAEDSKVSGTTEVASSSRESSEEPKSSPEMRLKEKSTSEEILRDSTTSASSVDLPPPNEPPPPPPLPAASADEPAKGAVALSEDKTKPPPYENIWIPDGGGAPVLEKPAPREKEEPKKQPPTAAASKSPAKEKRSPPPAKPKRLSKQISLSFKLDRSSTATDLDNKDAPTRRMEPLPSSSGASSLIAEEDEDSKSTGSASKNSVGSSDSTKDKDSQPHSQKLKSASTTNLSFIAKRLSFTGKFVRKVADQSAANKSPLMSFSPSAAAVPEEGSDDSSSSSTRRKSSLLSDISWPGTKSHSGPLYVYSKSKKAGAGGGVQEKWVVLGNANIRYFNQSDSMAEPKEMILLRDILSVYKRTDEEAFKGEEQAALYCFDVAFLKPGKSNKISIRSFGSVLEAVRDSWVDKIAQSLSHGLANFSMSGSSGCGKLGWVYLKSMFAGDWHVSWIALRGSDFLYQAAPDGGGSAIGLDGEEHELESVDLKKTKNVTLVKDVKNLSVLEPSLPVLVVDFTDRSLYLQSRSEKESLHWKSALESIAFSNAPLLSDQQLTRDGVPVVVEQCVNFVFRHGCMSEGIYRHSGVKTKIDRLLGEFGSNAWAVTMTREEYSEHDVANALKRFMRTLQEPLLTVALRERWMAAAKLQSRQEKLSSYQDLLRALPPLHWRTLRRLVGHLRAVANQCERNLMPDYNLAAIWGPTLLTVDGQPAPFNFAQTSGEADVCRDLIEHFKELFDVTEEEISREEKIMKKTENFNRNPNPVKLSGEVMMFVYFDTKSGGDCVSIAVTPKMTARELQKRAIKKANYTGDTEGFILHEVILRGEMERPIHYKELIYEVTLKWWQWPEEDRRDTYLLLKRNTFLDEAIPCAIPPLSVFGEAHFGDNSRSNKTFKKFMFSMNNAKITRSKESTKSGGTSLSELESWDIERIIWYLGCESKRKAPHNLNVTFIDRDPEGASSSAAASALERSRERPYFGRSISFSSRELFVKWIAAMLVAEHGQDLLAPDTLLNIDDD